MRVELLPGMDHLNMNTIHGRITLSAGQAIDVPEDLARQLIAQRLVKRTDIPWIQNDQVIVFDIGKAGPPVGKPVPRGKP